MIFHGRMIEQNVRSVKSTSCGLPAPSERGHVNGMEDPPHIQIGERLRRLRLSMDPESTQKSWAEGHGFNLGQYRMWETGLRRIPVDCAERLCDLYGLTLDFIYRGRRDGLSENARKVV